MKKKSMLLGLFLGLAVMGLVSCQGVAGPVQAGGDDAVQAGAKMQCCDLCEKTGGLLCRKNLKGFNQKALDAQLKSGALKLEKLFDGKTLKGWTTLDGKPITKGWVVKDGTIFHEASGGSLHTAKKYTNFILDLEWKISKNGNSGIKYRFTNYAKKGWNGPEYQVLDDEGHPDAKLGNGERKTACLYDIMKADTKSVYKKAGQWNKTRIVAYGPIVQHWLNGKMVLQYNIDSPAFKKAVQDSKFKSYPNYCGLLTGVIHLQDHGNQVWYRNITIIPLD